MLDKALICILLFAFCTQGIAKKDSSVSVKLCKRSDPNVEKCWKSSLDHLMLQLADESPLDPIDPMKVPLSMVKTTNYTIIYNHLIFKGAKHFEVQEAKLNPHNIVAFKIFFPYLLTSFNFISRGHFANIPVDGDGSSSLNFTDITLNWNLKTDFFTVGEITFRNMVGCVDNIKISCLKLNSMDVSGSEEKSELWRKTINDNIDLVYEPSNALLKKSFAEKLSHTLVKAYNTFPIAP